MNKKFEFNYYAPTESEKKEIEQIKKQYEPLSDHSKNLDKLRKLDAKVKNIPTCIALIFGVVGLLIFGTGLALAIEWNLIVWGVIVGVVGCALMGIAYFSYIKLYNKLKNKYGNEIIALSTQLLGQDTQD